MKRKHIAILGAGISGLTAAFKLKEKGYGVTLLEKRSSIGGSIQTVADSGFLVELGPNSALETTPLIKKLASELGIEDQMIFANQSADKRFILKDGVLHTVPMSPLKFFGSSLFSTRAKLRLLKEPFVARGSGTDESLASFVKRRFGREFLDYAVNPFVAGVYAGDPEDLSVAAAFPKLYQLEAEHGSVLRGAVAGRKERKLNAKRGEVSKQSARLFSFQNGLSTLTESLFDRLKDDVITNADVIRLETGGGQSGDNAFRVFYEISGETRELHSDAVIISVPAYTAARLIAEIDEELSRKLAEVAYPPVSMVFLGYRTEDIRRSLDGFGFLVPEREKRKILGTIWSSSIFPGRAPDGFAAFTTFVGGSRQPGLCEQSEKKLLEAVHGEIAGFLGIDAEPAYSRIKSWRHAIPQYRMGYPGLIEHLDSFEQAVPGGVFCANFKGGISLADCIQNAHKVSDMLARFLS